MVYVETQVDFWGEESCLSVTKANFNLYYSWVLLGCCHSLAMPSSPLFSFPLICFPIFLKSYCILTRWVQFLQRFLNYYFLSFSPEYLLLKTYIFWQHLPKTYCHSNPMLNTKYEVETFSCCSSSFSSCSSPLSSFSSSSSITKM